jgi:hypothetical protein
MLSRIQDWNAGAELEQNNTQGTSRASVLCGNVDGISPMLMFGSVDSIKLKPPGCPRAQEVTVGSAKP